MKYHKFRFGFKKNFKVLLCRVFGHRLNENPAHHWCERCGLAYEEAYHPANFFTESGIIDGSQFDENEQYRQSIEIDGEEYFLPKPVFDSIYEEYRRFKFHEQDYCPEICSGLRIGGECVN